MKINLLLAFLISSQLVSCNNNGSELENLKKENAVLTKQLSTFQNGETQNVKYLIKFKLRQSHLSLSIKTHIKDRMNAMEFEIPVDKDYFDSVNEGDKVVDKFRFGSMFLYSSFGDWEMSVVKKEIKQS